MDLARKFSPKDVTLYLMDFGTNGLAPLGQLPQVADTLLLDQTEKIAKFVRIMERELNRRKKLLSDYGVGTLELYRQASGQQEPAIVILLDSYESMKEEAYEAELFKLLVRISREGLSIGVHLLVTAGRQSNLRAQFYANFKHQLSLPQNDVGEVRSIVGSTPLAATMEDIKGRALMKRDEVDVIQLALPVAGANDAQVLNNLRQEVASLQEAWTGQRPSAIPMVPEELTEADFYSRASVQAAYEKGLVPLGLDMETVEPITWNLSKGNLLYLTDKEEQMSALTEQIARGKQKVIVLAPKYHPIPDLEGVLLVSSEEDQMDMIQAVKSKVTERLEAGSREHVVTIIVYNLSELVQTLTIDMQEQLEFILEKGLKAGYASIIMSPANLSRNIDPVSRIAKNYKQALLAMRVSDQSILTVTNRIVREPQLEEQEHYYIADNQANKVKVIMQ
ncbi:ESX-1 secretion system protein EccCb1 [Streptococcus sanguinis]|nr:ESX-1 secretion system protein EccCb1 [Streptococcus sanguinis]